MRIAIFGAGAIGLDLAANLIKAKHDVAIIARNQTLSALFHNGIQYYDAGGEMLTLRPDTFRVSDKPESLGTYDVIFLTVKSDALLGILENVPYLLHKNSYVVFATNGIPPWYSIGQPILSGYLNNTNTRDALLRHITPERILGMVVNRNVTATEPGIVRHNAGDGYKIGEIDHSVSPRLNNLSSALKDAGFSIIISDNIHRDIWHKLLVNISINPLTVITGQPIGRTLDDPNTYALAKHVMEEVHSLGIKLGVVKKDDFDFDGFLQKFRTQRYEQYTSMYNDFSAGKPLERERIINVVFHLAQLDRVSFEMPHLLKLAHLLEDKDKKSSG